MDKIRTLDAKYLYGLIGVVAILLVLVDVLVLMGPQGALLSGLQKKVADAQEEITTLKANIQRMPLFKKQLEEVRWQVEDVGRLVYSKDDIPLILKKVSSIANDTGVKIDALIPQKEARALIVKTEEGSYFADVVYITAKAGYHEFARFVNGLENARVLWKIDNLVVVSDPADTRKPRFKMTMRSVVLERIK